MTRSVLGAIGAGVAVLVLGVAVIVAVTRSAGTAIVDLETGDCFALPELDEGDAGSGVATIDWVDVVPCSEPHDAEVVATGPLNPDGDLPYPDDPALFELTDAACAVPVPAGFGMVPMAPGPAAWEARGGPYHCLAVPLGGEPTTGSIGS